MQTSEMDFGAGRPIDGYGAGFFRVGGVIHEGPLILTSEGGRSWAGLGDLAALEALAGLIDVLLIGTGATAQWLPPERRERLRAAGLRPEIMGTPPACRTYNVLLAEGRRVGAALVPV